MLDDHTRIKNNIFWGLGKLLDGDHGKHFWVANFLILRRFALQEKACRGGILHILGSSLTRRCVWSSHSRRMCIVEETQH